MKVLTKYPVIIDGKSDSSFESISNAEGMKVFTTYPVIINKEKINTSDFYVSADGEEYLPFDGKTKLLGFKDECGDEYFCSVDGEHFYNAKGEKLVGFFKKVGKGVVKTGKFIGKVAKKVGRALAKASKKVAHGVKKVGGKVKSGAKKLIHHKKKTKSGSDKDSGSDKGKSPLDTFKDSAKKSAENAPDTGLKGLSGKGSTDKTSGEDVFTQKLKDATSSTPPEKTVEVAGKKYSTENLPEGKEVVQTTDENGNPIAGVEFAPSEVVGVTGADGNIEYHTPDNVGGMSKGMKIALFVGGGIALAAILYFALRTKKK